MSIEIQYIIEKFLVYISGNRMCLHLVMRSKHKKQ